MFQRFLASTVMIVGFGLSGFALAQDTPATVLNYEMAQRAMDAALAEARDNGWNMTIVVADHAGTPVMIHRMDGASARTYEIALAKAKVVTETGLFSGEYGRLLEAGEIEEVEGGIHYAGGVPVMLNGEQIGAVTASGARGSEDEQVSLAGATVIGN
ncbi:MAG: heme-binding protein [Gammaproteobacteria bacterium]|nr:heme-binding protein [Pseudomonadales bacterium]MCP5345255.1 heme-binding protein [Pseudomonadales bacterium]